MLAAFEKALAELDEKGRLRRLAPRAGIDFTSNDYLGLAGSRELIDAAAAALDRGVPVGAGGSRLLRGNHPEHEALEAEAAQFFGAETALFFPSGFLANYAILSTLPQRGDLIVHDALIHASAHDGMRVGRAEHVAAAHNDADAFADAIAAWRRRGGTGRPWIAVESLYSMDGDRAPLHDLAQIAERHDGMLLVDEAHATGVFGPQGRGLGHALEGRPDVIALHTCGKALGAVGALVCAPALLRDFLVNRCRPLIYATAPSPLIAAVVRRALELCRDAEDRRAQLADLVSRATTSLAARNTGVAPSGSQILPVIVGSDRRAVALANALQARGFDVRAIRPPTVPEGTSRLRIALTLNVTAAEVDALVATLADELESLSP
jgi:8-amino-7-oxononanoate synthase